jgi:hypothetical protein
MRCCQLLCQRRNAALKPEPAVVTAAQDAAVQLQGQLQLPRQPATFVGDWVLYAVSSASSCGIARILIGEQVMLQLGKQLGDCGPEDMYDVLAISLDVTARIGAAASEVVIGDVSGEACCRVFCAGMVADIVRQAYCSGIRSASGPGASERAAAVQKFWSPASLKFPVTLVSRGAAALGDMHLVTMVTYNDTGDNGDLYMYLVTMVTCVQLDTPDMTCGGVAGMRRLQ